MDNWISVRDKLPSTHGSYLVYGRFTKDCPMQVLQADFYKKSGKFYTMHQVKGVTHWQSLPAPPVIKTTIDSTKLNNTDNAL